jgi:hypothetical protein
MRQALELSQHQERPYADIFRGQAGAQLLMAKITSHFKHGTERVSWSKIRNHVGQ